jgi:hypothetical protein
VEPVSNLVPIAPPPALYPQKPSRTKASEPAAVAADRVELSDEAVAASNGQATKPQPKTYGPRGAFVHDIADRQAGLADTNRSRHLSDIMSEIAAVQQSTAELLARQRQLHV